MVISTPNWVKHAIFYQIFPDRFARSPRTYHPQGLKFKPWGSPPEEQGYQGGDLRGVVDKLDYLQALGVTAIYFNPIFSSASNHRYHTFDYFQVDPLLGGNEALRELLDEAHSRNMRIVLDGVFNHASRGFWPFHHILENGGDSPYIDWFTVYDWPLQPYPTAKDQPLNYAAWWNLPALPKLNIANPAVQEYILEVARYWVEFGIDGWRLDVPFEIDDDVFWRKFRQVVKRANPEAYICGEVWEEAQRWLEGDQFDGVMNYIFTWISLSFFGGRTLRPDYQREHFTLEALNAAKFAREVDRLYSLYDWNINCAQLNLLDSHDTARALWIMGEDKSALRLCVLFQMTMPGAPCIYYGDEIGLSSGDDPYCRAAFPWEQPETWDMELLTFYQQASALRHQYPVLRTGTFEALYAADTIYSFWRKLDQQEAIVLFNTAAQPVSLTLATPSVLSGIFKQAWPHGQGKSYQVDQGQLEVTLLAREAVVLVNDL
jgi:neopullulanase